MNGGMYWRAIITFLTGKGKHIVHRFISFSCYPVTVKTTPEWPHRYSTLAWHAHCPWTRVRAPVAAASLAISRLHLQSAIRGAQEVLPMRVGGATSQLDQPSLMPLAVAACFRLQLGVPN